MRFHIVKRDNCPLWKKLCIYLAAVVMALVLGAVRIPLSITAGCLLWVPLAIELPIKFGSII